MKIVALLVLLVGGVLVWILLSEREEAPPPVNETTDEVAADHELTRQEREEGIERHIRANISELSPEPEVLGGTFYVTDIRFIDENSGEVEYEDGHIALVADFTYSFDEEGRPQVTLTNVRQPEL